VSESIDLSAEDYTDLDFWKEVTETQLIPQGNNLTDSSSISGGGMVVVNDVRGAVEAYVLDATVTATTGNIALTALENATILATADSSVSSSGGSAFGEGTSLAVNGTVATNVVLSEARAYLQDSTATATAGNITLDADNTSTLDATTLQATTTGDTAVGVLLAFNTIGWASQNLLFNAIDALLGTPIGTEDPAVVEAYIKDSVVTASGDLTLTATSAATLTAEVRNDSTAAASAMFGASATSYTGILASNKVSSTAQAYIDNTTSDTLTSDPTGATKDVAVGGNITITADDQASIDAQTNLQSATSSSNDGGVGILNGLIGTLLDTYQYTTNSDLVALKFGDKVRLAGGDFDGDGDGDGVDYAGGTGTPGAVYEYMGADANVNLSSEDYADPGLWKELTQDNAIPKSIFTTALKAAGAKLGGGAKGLSGLVSRNDVRSDVDAYIPGLGGRRPGRDHRQQPGAELVAGAHHRQLREDDERGRRDAGFAQHLDHRRLGAGQREGQAGDRLHGGVQHHRLAGAGPSDPDHRRADRGAADRGGGRSALRAGDGYAGRPAGGRVPGRNRA
jgi:hypothetical protein